MPVEDINFLFWIEEILLLDHRGAFLCNVHNVHPSSKANEQNNVRFCTSHSLDLNLDF